MPQNKLRRYTCKQGHDYMDFQMWVVSARSKENNIDASSGPLCVLCYIEWLRTTFPTVETVVEQPTVVLGEATASVGTTVEQPIVVLDEATHE